MARLLFLLKRSSERVSNASKVNTYIKRIFSSLLQICSNDSTIATATPTFATSFPWSSTACQTHRPSTLIHCKSICSDDHCRHIWRQNSLLSCFLNLLAPIMLIPWTMPPKKPANTSELSTSSVLFDCNSSPLLVSIWCLTVRWPTSVSLPSWEFAKMFALPTLEMMLDCSCWHLRTRQHRHRFSSSLQQLSCFISLQKDHHLGWASQVDCAESNLTCSCVVVSSRAGLLHVKLCVSYFALCRSSWRCLGGLELLCRGCTFYQDANIGMWTVAQAIVRHKVSNVQAVWRILLDNFQCPWRTSPTL